MANFSIAVDLGELLNIGPFMRASLHQNLSAAVERVTRAVAERFREAILKAPLWDRERNEYAESVTWRMTGNYEGEIGSLYKFCEDIENGRPPRDLKLMLGTSLKVRVNKKGQRYLIIPFRHNTPGNDALASAMPASVYSLARDLSPSRITGQGTRMSGTGAYDISTKKRYLVRQNTYQGGGRLAAGPDVPKKYVSMYKFDTSTSGSKSSKYLSFRTMTEGSSKWIVPAKPGLHLAQKVVDELKPDAERVFQAAVLKDVGGRPARHRHLDQQLRARTGRTVRARLNGWPRGAI